MTRSIPAILLTALVAMTVVELQAAEYQVDRTADNKVVFVSDAPIEDFEGTTDRIDGYVLFDADSLTPGMNLDSSKVYFEVDLASLDTGIGLRNRHMRENYLETDKHPYATYTGRLDAVELCTPDSCRVRTSGTISIHGVDRPVDLLCTVIPTSNGCRVRSEFIVKLTDHKIEVPSLMFMKISEEIVLRLDLALSRVGATATR